MDIRTNQNKEIIGDHFLNLLFKQLAIISDEIFFQVKKDKKRWPLNVVLIDKQINYTSMKLQH